MARIAFCQDVMVEYMGYMCMAAVLKNHGHTVEVFFDSQTNEDAFIDEIKRFNPDIVGFSLLSPTLPWALKTAKRIKQETKAVTICGNVHAMVSPEIIEDENVDIVCLAEGELLLKELADCLDKGQSYTHIEGLWIKTRQGIIKNPMPKRLLDLDKMPFHDRSLYDKYPFFRHSEYVRFHCGRGCPFRCTFCSNQFIAKHYGISNYVRKRDPALIIEELKGLVKKRHPKHIFFIDEVFWVDNDWLRKFLALYRDNIHIPFTANFRWGRGLTEEDIKLFKDAGLESLILAVETADEKQRLEMFHKPVRDEEIFKIAGWLHKYRIDFVASAFFGLPGDTVEEHVKRLDFFRKLKPAYIWTTFFQPYPGVELSESAEVKKYAPKNGLFEPTLHHDMYLDLPHKNELSNLKKVYFLLMIWPRSVPFFLWLIRRNLKFLFDVIFSIHFSYYIFKFERVSLFQYLVHMKIFGLNTLLKKRKQKQNVR